MSWYASSWQHMLHVHQQAWHCKESDEKVQVAWSLCSRSTLNELI